jgi:hypothetical protein
MPDRAAPGGKVLANKEIEITPEMVEAGAYELASYNTDFESVEDAVVRIYEAMILASWRHRSQR